MKNNDVELVRKKFQSFFLGEIAVNNQVMYDSLRESDLYGKIMCVFGNYIHNYYLCVLVNMK